jgi:putative solute:sodium symporter small subunit
VEPLNAIRLGGFQLGFWFAQQGSIYVFVALIFVYVWRMNKLDREYDVDE